MAEETPVTQAATGTEADQASAGQQTEQFDAEYVKTLRKEAATYRTRLKELETKVGAFEQERMSETDKLKAQAADAMTQAQAAQSALKQARAEVAVATAAAKQGLDAGLLLRLIDLEFNEAGDPINVDAAVTAVLKQYPQLKPAAAQMGATNPNRPAAKLSMEDIKRMTPDEINTRWEEVQAAMSGK